MKQLLSKKGLGITFVILALIALILKMQSPQDLHTYPLSEEISLKRLDYFSHYQLVDNEGNVIMNKVNKIGEIDSKLLFFNELGEALQYSKEDGVILELSSSEIAEMTELETYNPWSYTDTLNYDDQMKFLLRLVYFAMAIVFTAFMTRILRSKS
jgi:hypothetical protein